MSKVTIEFRTDNAAFQDDLEGAAAYVLRQVFEKITPETDCILFDPNGNVVGTLVVSDKWFI